MHSIYVDQWDWEKVITAEMRTESVLRATVNAIVGCICDAALIVRGRYPSLHTALSREVSFISSQELEDLYPDLSPKERENAYLREHPTTFLSQIGGKLRSGKPHDGRAPDYDDWSLNGDILFYNPLLDCAFEVSSMGIRVDPETLDRQLTLAGCDARRSLPFHRMLLEGQAAPDDGRRHRTVAPMYAAVGQGAHWRGSILHLGCADPSRLRGGGRHAAVRREGRDRHHYCNDQRDGSEMRCRPLSASHSDWMRRRRSGGGVFFPVLRHDGALNRSMNASRMGLSASALRIGKSWPAWDSIRSGSAHFRPEAPRKSSCPRPRRSRRWPASEGRASHTWAVFSDPTYFQKTSDRPAG